MTDDTCTCPVCGEGQSQAYYAPHRKDAVAYTAVEHLDCVLELWDELATLKRWLKHVLDVGYNNDCLFCALKDTAALGGREAARKYAEETRP